jgi:hypothetical protein
MTKYQGRRLKATGTWFAMQSATVDDKVFIIYFHYGDYDLCIQTIKFYWFNYISLTSIVTENIYEWIRKIDKFSIATQFLNRRNVVPNVETGIYKLVMCQMILIQQPFCR